ncbi:copper resistance CopC family protein [Agromyces archimandritae]|uniref:Copper resistance protein CopC n=1 Tax=Agromyces archimandritae TaxID=2781962 RepID=A0A975FNC5_9MICO|nr:copper resistance CopC family protein [Agromyces archimandritae]QTX05595.1 copper resistance protein CopC [Agromyces archimandritae]
MRAPAGRARANRRTANGDPVNHDAANGDSADGDPVNHDSANHDSANRHAANPTRADRDPANHAPAGPPRGGAVMHTAWRSLTAGLLLGAVVAAAGLAIAAMPALAHNSPVSSSPAEGSTVTAQPGTVSLTTSDVLLDLGDGGAGIDVVDAAGLHYATECAVIDGPTVEAAAALGEPGEYTVKWRVVSADGHPISGEFAFDWRPAAGVELAEGSTEPACEVLRDGAGDGGAGDGGADDAVDAGDAADAGDSADSAGIPGEVWWIGGTVLAVVVAGGVTWMLARRRVGGDG